MSAPRWRGFSNFVSDFDRWNHILVPSTKEERDRFRNARAARALRWIVVAFERFSDEGKLLLLFCLFAGALALDSKRSDVYLAWAIVGGLLVASWFGSFFYGLAGVSVELMAPPRVTVGVEAPFTVIVRNGGPRVLESLVVRGPFLPWDGAWLLSHAGVRRIPPLASERVELSARFRSRGDHHLDAFRVRALVPFGFAYGPALASEGLPFLVVPRTANVASLALPRGGRHLLGGASRTSRVADSRELLGVRPYRMGDSARDLHARTWARTGQPVVREYRDLYVSRVGIVLDTDVGRSPEADFEAAIALVAGIVDRLSGSEDVVDRLFLGEDVHDLSCARAAGLVEHTLELLARVRAGGELEPSALAARIAPALPGLSCLIVVTLRWDDARRGLVEGLAASGIGVTTLVVTEDAGEPDVPFGPNVRAIASRRVASGAPVDV